MISREDQVELCNVALRELDALERRRGPETDEQWRPLIRRLLLVPAGVEDAKRADALLRIARSIFYSGRRALNAVEPAALAVALGRMAGNDEIVCRALLVQGSVLNAVYDLNDGWRCFEDAYELAQQLKLPMLETMAANNLGVTCYELARYHQAIEIFDLALNRTANALDSDNSEMNRFRGSALANIALCHLHTLHHAAGLVAIEEAVALMGEPSDAPSTVACAFAEATRTKLLLATGRLDEAKEAAARVQHYAELSGSLQAQIEAAGATGLCEIMAGNADVGRSRVFNALEEARALPLSLRSALLTAAFACETSGDASGAVAYHREFALLSQRAYRTANLAQRKVPLAISGDANDGAIDLNAVLGEHEKRFRESLAQHMGNEARLISLAAKAEAPVDPEGFHPFRVARLCGLLAEKLGMDRQRCAEIESAALLHDIGMIGIPRMTQLKKGELDQQERQFIRNHPVEGCAIVATADLPYVEVAEEVIRGHHERYDGAGYPDGLRGSGIPASARICAIADAFDVMTHGRPYAERRSVAGALAEIELCRGTQFDPAMVDAFVPMIHELLAAHPDLDEYLARDAADTPLARAKRIVERSRAAALQ